MVNNRLYHDGKAYGLGGMCACSFFGHIITARDGDVWDIEFDNGKFLTLSDNYGLLTMIDGIPSVVQPSKLVAGQSAIDIFGAWSKIVLVAERKGKVFKVEGMESLNINDFIVDGYKERNGSKLPTADREISDMQIQDTGEATG